MMLMRQLEAEHIKTWDQLSKPNPEMEEAQDCDPALLSGWTDSDISLWDVSTDGRKPGRDKILVALCRKKVGTWDKISFLLFPAETVASAGLNLTASNGKTGDQRIDVSGTHFEIKGITGKQLCTLLFQISHSRFETGIFKKSEYDKILLEAYDNTATRPVVEGATSSTAGIIFSSSGTGEQSTSTILTPESAHNETPTSKFVPSPSSSTTQA